MHLFSFCHCFMLHVLCASFVSTPFLVISTDHLSPIFWMFLASVFTLLLSVVLHSFNPLCFTVYLPFSPTFLPATVFSHHSCLFLLPLTYISSAPSLSLWAPHSLWSPLLCCTVQFLALLPFLGFPLFPSISMYSDLPWGFIFFLLFPHLLYPLFSTFSLPTACPTLLPSPPSSSTPLLLFPYLPALPQPVSSPYLIFSIPPPLNLSMYLCPYLYSLLFPLSVFPLAINFVSYFHLFLFLFAFSPTFPHSLIPELKQEECKVSLEHFNVQNSKE